MPVSLSDLQLAFEFVSSGGMSVNEAYLDRQSGKIYWHSEFGDNDEELPDDIGDDKYISIPDKRQLDLGKALVLDFAREVLPVFILSFPWKAVPAESRKFDRPRVA
jgi:hypothetical protein